MKKLLFPALCALLALCCAACAPQNTEMPEVVLPVETHAIITQTPTDEAPVETATTAPSAAATEETKEGACSEEEYTENVTVEGEQEAVRAIRHKSVHGYTISYYPDSFVCTETDNGESFMLPASENMPNTFLSVSVVSEYDLADTIAGLKTQNTIASEEAVQIGVNNYSATMLLCAEENTRVAEFYALEKSGVVYLIEVGYTTENAEGFGARLHAMLDTLIF